MGYNIMFNVRVSGKSEAWVGAGMSEGDSGRVRTGHSSRRRTGHHSHSQQCRSWAKGSES